MEQTQSNQSPSDKDYYSGKGRKVADFLIGCLGVAMSFLASYFLGAVSSFGDRIYNYGILLILAAAIGMLIWAKRAKREFIFKGILVTILPPFIFTMLLFGSCSLSNGGL